MTTTWPVTPDEALQFLLDGNERFVRGDVAHPNQDAARREAAALDQKPFAVLFGCSDSRVAAEIVFDRGLGDLFVVRTAGHLVGEEVLASIDYAVAVLETPLVVVLSHDSCGAVGAALQAHESGVTPPGHLRSIVERLTPEILQARATHVTDPDEVTRLHGRHTARAILEQSPLVRERVEAGDVGVVVLAYQLVDGRTHVVASHGLTVPA
ncbi:MAG TPA: carbonic anhydrase [Kineosporiaceae bacterium]|jgi:carbonic anhydrase|nr:carbonic anhydrase [Kineosporiaceae bacterium]